MAGQTILLVEDDRDIRESLTDVLCEEGYRVVGATDGLDAIACLEKAPALPDLILLDLMMPRMNGEQFRARIAGTPDWSHIPFVLLTADPIARSKAEALGASGFLRKPVKLDTLFEMVARVLENA